MEALCTCCKAGWVESRIIYSVDHLCEIRSNLVLFNSLEAPHSVPIIRILNVKLLISGVWPRDLSLSVTQLSEPDKSCGLVDLWSVRDKSICTDSGSTFDAILESLSEVHFET